MFWGQPRSGDRLVENAAPRPKKPRSGDRFSFNSIR